MDSTLPIMELDPRRAVARKGRLSKLVEALPVFFSRQALILGHWLKHIFYYLRLPLSSVPLVSQIPAMHNETI